MTSLRTNHPFTLEEYEQQVLEHGEYILEAHAQWSNSFLVHFGRMKQRIEANELERSQAGG